VVVVEVNIQALSVKKMTMQKTFHANSYFKDFMAS